MELLRAWIDAPWGWGKFMFAVWVLAPMVVTMVLAVIEYYDSKIDGRL